MPTFYLIKSLNNTPLFPEPIAKYKVPYEPQRIIKFVVDLFTFQIKHLCDFVNTFVMQISQNDYLSLIRLQVV